MAFAAFEDVLAWTAIAIPASAVLISVIFLLVRGYRIRVAIYMARAANIAMRADIAGSNLALTRRADKTFQEVLGCDPRREVRLRTERFVYVIRRFAQTQVMDDMGGLIGHTCVHIGGCPDSDRRLAEYLMLKNDELEYWKRANFGFDYETPDFHQTRRFRRIFEHGKSS